MTEHVTHESSKSLVHEGNMLLISPILDHLNIYIDYILRNQ